MYFSNLSNDEAKVGRFRGMEGGKMVSISELVQGRRPLTATSTLHSPPSTSSHTPPISSSSSFPNSNLPPSTPAGGVTAPRILTPLNHPSYLIGTLTLPSYLHSTPALPCCSHSTCFVFSDASSTVCCDVLHLDLRIIGNRIRVLSWNFIPSKCGGFLEIIRWSFLDSTAGLSRCSNLDAFPLVLGSSSASKDGSKGRYSLRGVLESVSPVSVIPCSVVTRTSQSGSGTNFSTPSNLRGFLAQIMVCECELCCSKEVLMSLDDPRKGLRGHCFTKPQILYFCGSGSSWHPLFTKLIGNVICISHLKKKLVFIGKEESQLMYVTTGKTVLRVLSMANQELPHKEAVIKGMGECGLYSGIITGIYMQGMVINLDERVWLLITDRLLNPPHSLRVGALISVRNIHFLNPKFSWTEMLILGSCFKTSIIVECFSPLETGCHKVSQSQSLLGKFIDSLAFSARLWVLLVVSCFRKKFCGILTEKEILGSKHREGLVQVFARSHLPSSVFQYRYGVFMEFCKHDSCGCGTEPNYDQLKLVCSAEIGSNEVAPISNLVHHCEAMWMKNQLEGDCETMVNNNKFSQLSCGGRSHGLPITRILPSEAIGVILLGSLKISPSGRLQLIDATGFIDIVIPDLPSDCNSNSIYEVNDYSLVMEGMPDHLDHFGLVEMEPFSCRSIFESSPLVREISLTMYVYFHLRKSSLQNFLVHPHMNLKDNLKELEDGRFHMLHVTHKFPVLQKFQKDQVVSDGLSMLVEAVVLPWDLFLSGKNPTKVSKDQKKEPMELYNSRNYHEYVSFKRCKIDHASSRLLSSGLTDKSSVAGMGLCGHLSDCSSANKQYPVEIPCLACCRSGRLVSSGSLYCTEAALKFGAGCKLGALKVLLEFKSESFFKYQLLQIGGYYITKHQNKDLFCNHRDFDYVRGGKFLITSGTTIWSLSFSYDEIFHYTDPSFDPALVTCPLHNSQQTELLLQRSTDNCHEMCSDIHLHLPADLKKELEVDFTVLEKDLIKTAPKLEEVANVPLCIETAMTASMQSFQTDDSAFLLPEGNLVSLQGQVLAVHNLNHTSLDAHSSNENYGDVRQLRLSRGVTWSTCIHVLMDHHIVSIFGGLSEHAYPTGFGPGVVATFHRILELGGQNRLMLTPVSFIAINSMKLNNDQYNAECSNPVNVSELYNFVPLDAVSSCLISELIQCLECKPMQFHCRIVAVHFLVLEKNRKSQPKVPCRLSVDIPLASFVLDDGSSSCCCWANAERAATLLRLHEEFPLKAFGSSSWKLKGIGIDNACRTTIYHLDKLLKKHGRITVKNYGSISDSSSQDLMFSVGSNDLLSSSDENLLKFIILNACIGTFWTIIGDVMDSEAVGQLEEHVPKMGMTMHAMQSIWAKEVSYANPLTEARNMVEELLNR